MKQPKKRDCAQCGRSLVRTQIRPPVYQCAECEPLRPERHCAAWSGLFDDYYGKMARALAWRAPYARPPWCFIETNLVAMTLRSGWKLDAEACGFYMHQGAGLIAWRAAKSIYRLHPALLAELLDTPVSGALPVESLMRMPVWCPYVECDLPVLWGCDEQVAKEHRIVGMFAYLDFMPLQEPCVPTLRLLLDVVDLKNPDDFEPGLLMSTQLALEPGLTVDQSIARVDELVAEQLEEVRRRIGAPGVALEDMQNGELPSTFRDTVRRLISVLLYLCAENAEVDKRTAPQPCRLLGGPAGPRFYEPPEVTLVRCGQHVGGQLQRAREAHERAKLEAPRGGSVAPHVRAAHWHHFWKGPRDGARELVLRWLAPIFVNLDDEPPDAITVRAVT